MPGVQEKDIQLQLDEEHTFLELALDKEKRRE
jgi:HSP20 family molecular chaperone IbpA